MIRIDIVSWWGSLALVAVLVLCTLGCATNPATGRSQLMLISEQQEIEIGSKADPEVSRSMGLYDDPELQAYVQQLGLRLAKNSERPALPWSFKVIDDPVVNAFALPGGYIYVTRGILGHLGSEAQLVTVLGHEIGHVTARHSASQISKQQLASLGFGVGLVLEPGLMQFGDLLQMGAGLLFLKFSRDDERQADDLGLRYGLQAEYDLRQAPQVFVTLGRVSQLADAGRIPGWLSTHPEPENRVERLQSQLASLNRDLSGARVGRQEYLRRLDGVVWGENPREGYFEDEVFLHPDLRFRIEFPSGWKLSNQKQSVSALSEEQDAAIVLTLTDKTDSQAAAAEFARQSGVRADRGENRRFNGLPSTWMSFEAESGQTQLRGRVAFVTYERRVYRLLGYGLTSRWQQYDSTVESSLKSFAELRDPAALAVQPDRLEIITLPRDMTLIEFHDRYPSNVAVERVAVMNQVEPNSPLKRGELIKRVVAGRS